MYAPLVSIVINNYNYGRYLRQAIDSALQQTYRNIEVIVVDDGSTDNSRDILQTYGDAIRVVLKANGGQASAINTGVEESRGELIATLDADDLYEPHAVAEVVRAWLPETVRVHFPLRVITADGSDCGVLNPRANLAHGDLRQVLLKYGRYVSAPTSATMYSRSVLKKVLPVPDSWDDHDGYLDMLVPFFGPVTALEEPLGCYRIHDQNKSGVFGLDRRCLRRLIRHNEQKWNLLKDFCAEHQLPLRPEAALDHWSHQKLLLTLAKVDGQPATGVWYRMISSVRRCSHELSLGARLKLVIWATSVLLLPGAAATPIMELAYSHKSLFSVFTGKGLERRLPRLISRSNAL